MNIEDRRFLILDDDELLGQTMVMIAQSGGCAARHTTSPDEFFHLLDGWQPTHIGLDLIMPDMDGVQVLAALAKRNCRAWIIISSGVGGRVLDAARRSAEEHGLTIGGILSKPFSPSQLRSLLKQGGTPAPAQDRDPAHPHRGSEPIDAEELELAVRNDELTLVYQPKVRCSDGALAGFEALVRWQSPERGMVFPDRFVPLAESSGLIDQLTDKVLELSLDWFSGAFGRQSWTEPGPTAVGGRHQGVTLSVNLSALTLGDADFVERIVSRCRAFGVPPNRVILELTETAAMDDPVASLDQLTRLRMKGFQLSIDDFGTASHPCCNWCGCPFPKSRWTNHSSCNWPDRRNRGQ